MRLVFSDAELEPSSAPSPYDLVLGAVATVRLVSDDDRIIYAEDLVPVVELALALKDWLREEVQEGADFSFDSVESDEPGQLWCRRVEGGWQVGSSYQDTADLTVHRTRDLVEVLDAFVRDVEAWLGRTTGRRLEEVRP